jgi:hypothetical protein
MGSARVQSYSGKGLAPVIKGFFAAATIGLLMTTATQAGVVFDTVTNITPLSASGNANDTSTIMATSVSVAGTPDFHSISLLLAADSPDAGGSVLVYLVPDTGTGAFADVPSLSSGNLIGTIRDSAMADTADGLTSLISLTHFSNPRTASDGMYWVALDATNSSVEWSYNADASGLGTANQFSFSDANDQYSDDGSTGLGAFAMIVDAPEPATLALLGGGLAGLGYIRRRNNKQRRIGSRLGP